VLVAGGSGPYGPAMTDAREPRRGRLWGTAEAEPWLTPGRLAALVAVLTTAYAAIIVVRALRGVLIMLLVALFLAFAMEPAVQHLARRGWRRGLATGAVFVAVVLGTIGILWVLIPFVFEQVSALIRAIPTSLEELNRILAGLPFGLDVDTRPELQEELLAFTGELGDRLREVALGAAGEVVTIGATALGMIARALAVLLITFYLVADGPRLRRALARPIPPGRQREMLAIWELAVAKTGGYIYSRLLIGGVSGVVHFIALLAIGIPNALALAIWMGLLTAFIPLLGVPTGGALLLIAALVHDPTAALWLFIVIMAYQQIENYVLGPKIQAHVMDLHPAVAFTSVIVGATLLGFVGVLLALPAAAITKALLSTYVHRHELIEELREVPLELEEEADTAEDEKEEAATA
jgi:predicted PurR-regulated permease PerM